MITFRISTEVKADRQVVLTLPADVPTGPVELVVTVDSAVVPENGARAGTADWLESQSANNGSNNERYPLRGKVLGYDQPTEPVAEGDWEASR